MAANNQDPVTDSARQVPDPSAVTSSRISESVGNLDEKITYRINSIEKAVAVAHDDLVRVPTAVDRAILQLRELVETKIKCVEEEDQISREAISKHVDVALAQLNALSAERATVVKESIIALTESLAVYKQSVSERFALLAEQTEKAARDVKSAVDAAFAAQAASVSQQNTANALASNKQEAAFTKQIDQLQQSLAQAAGAIDDKLESVKKVNDDKYSDLKDRVVAMEGRKQGGTDQWGWIFGAFGLIASLAAVALVMVELAHH